jgi:predicted transposase YbfD/YdcC
MSVVVVEEVGSLWAALGGVRDHRRCAGRRYPLRGLLLVAVAAMLAGRRDQLGIVRWGRQLRPEALASLGISRGRVPAPSVWCELFQELEVGSLEAVLGAWVRGGRPAGHIAMDGKRLRGSATATAPGAHLLAAFSDALGGVVGQLQVPPDSNEITAALDLLRALPLEGSVVTGDAIFAQKEICRVIRDGGGDYFFTVKDNQPALKADIALAFGGFSPSAARLPPDLTCAETVGKEHGRLETRTLQATASLAAYLGPAWPGVAQVCRITRRRLVRGQESVETVYAITSLPPGRANAADLLALSRSHWGIENRLHHVRDVTCREDQCRTRARAAPQVLAAMRNTVLTIIRRSGRKPVEGFEHYAEHRSEALNDATSVRTE